MGDVIPMGIERPIRSWKIVVLFERREDGGMRAWCDEIPGFVLSHRNVEGVLDDVVSALEGILSAQLGHRIIVTPLSSDIRTELEQCGIVGPRPRDEIPDHVEYAALCA